MNLPNYQISFSDTDNVSAWGGLALWSQFLRGIGFRDQVSQWALPEPSSNRGYDPTLIVEQFVTHVLCGANRMSHLNTLRLDKTVSRICDWPKMPEQKAFRRFFQRYQSCAQSTSLMSEVYRWCTDCARIPEQVTLDVDSTALTHFGCPEGAEVGYNTISRQAKPSSVNCLFNGTESDLEFLVTSR